MGPLSSASKVISPLVFLIHVCMHTMMLRVAAGHSPAPRCRTTCGNHIIRFPFGVDTGCGSPKFSMNCANSTTLQMVINSKMLFVDYIDYSNHMLFLRDPFMSNCANLNFNNAGLDLNLDSTGLALGQGSTILLLNCLSFAQEINLLDDQYDCHNPTCLAFMSSCHTNDLLTSCCRVTDPRNKIDLYPMQCMSYTSIYSPRDPIFNPSTWSYGIELQWSLPPDVTDTCNRCEAKDGICGYRSEETHQQFMCICESSLRCRGCMSGSCSGGRMTRLIVALCVAGAVLIFGVCILCLFMKRRNKFGNIRSYFTTESLNYAHGEDKHTGTELAHVLATMTGPLPLTLFSYRELEQATASFSDTRLIGDGAYGMVYKAKFCDGRVLAVKRLNHQHHRRLQHFYNEVRILSQLKHQNLVQLEGFCLQGKNLMLVYEYVSNGTLEEHLHRDDLPQAGMLAWETRLSIACDVAEALAYLHFMVSPPIYHRDVKSGNILLDEAMRAKVADFGLSRLVPMDATHVSTGPQGTPGYVDPEYHQCYQVSDKSDVYSFGVVLLEMLTGKRAVDLSRPRHEINLSAYAIARIQANEVNELLDPHLLSARHSQAALKVANLAFSCVALQRDARPNMKEVASQLQLIRLAPFKTVH